MAELINAEVTSPLDRESLGYKIIKEDAIRCGNCQKRLITILKVIESDIKNYFIVKCPYCGDKSFKYLIMGKVYIAPADNLVVGKVDTEMPTNDTIINNMELKRCQT